MKHLFTILFFLLLGCGIGHSLQCYMCAQDSCIKTQCNAGESCGKVVGHGVTAKSCVPDYICNTETGGLKTYCCKSDLCNSAVSARMSFATVVAVLVVLWMTKQ